MPTICDLGHSKTSNLYHGITRLSSFYLAIVDPRVDSTTPGSHLGVKMTPTPGKPRHTSDWDLVSVIACWIDHK